MIGTFGLKGIVGYSVMIVLEWKILWILSFGLSPIGSFALRILRMFLLTTLLFRGMLVIKSPLASITSSSWKPPTYGVLKLNFDESFFKDEHKGGYGGVIRNNADQVLCSLSGPMVCEDANGAEMFALLVVVVYLSNQA